MVLPAALGHISLCENQFCIYDLHRSVSDAVHLSDPFHLVAGFQRFRNALCICHLFYQPKKKFLCLQVNICKIGIKNNFSGFTKSTIFIPVERPKIVLSQIHICSNSFVGSPIFSAMISAGAGDITKIRLSYISLLDVHHQSGALLNISSNFSCKITKTGISKPNLFYIISSFVPSIFFH